MKSVKIMLAGIVLILISLFFMGICILNQGGVYGGIALVLLLIGAAISIFGFLWDVKL
ncbi:MAG: hypothetical protein IJW40_08410 [Clostridia bacterium]|nr:hypothetical protein [Clostridia bacterium]